MHKRECASKTVKSFLVKDILHLKEENDSTYSSPEQEKRYLKEENSQANDVTKEKTPGKSTQCSKTPEHKRQAKRKNRRCFTSEQIELLEECFRRCTYPDGKARQNIASQLRVSEYRVQIWFQNRRAKVRRQWKQMLWLPKALDMRSNGPQKYTENRRNWPISERRHQAPTYNVNHRPSGSLCAKPPSHVRPAYWPGFVNHVYSYKVASYTSDRTPSDFVSSIGKSAFSRVVQRSRYNSLSTETTAKQCSYKA